MSDEADRGNETAEVFLDAALTKRYPDGPNPIGKCFNCGGPMQHNCQRWCNAECRDDWERRSA